MSLNKTASRLFKKAQEEFNQGQAVLKISQQPTTPVVSETISGKARPHLDRAANILQKARAIQAAARHTATSGYQFVPEYNIPEIEKYRKFLLSNSSASNKHVGPRPTP